MGDAFFDEAFSRSVVQAIARDTTVSTARGKLHFRATSLGRTLALDEISALPISKPTPNSSNTVVTVGETLFLKGYRQLRSGINPELEIGRFLTEKVSFPACVPVVGSLEYTGDDGRTMTLALLQAYVPNQGDGWEYTLAYLVRVLSELRDTDGDPKAATHGAFLALMTVLGQRTAELHVAFAQRTGDAAFDPEPLRPEDIDGYRAHTRSEAQRTWTMLQGALSQLAPGVREDAERLLARKSELMARIDALPVEAQSGLRTRLHGDYHLGQVLVARNDFVIIDFEGEPARTFDERRTKGSPLRDVAGMLRSFNYARWSALRREAQNAEEFSKLDAAARAWEHETRTAFLAGYTGALGGGAAPADPALLALFEFEKACYELRYELGNRHDWVPVPLQGILAMLDIPAGG
jgi:maltose alpha-D-glucosyltransferase/alpha-amylase